MLSILALYVFFMPGNLPLYDLIMFPCPDPRTPDISRDLDQLRHSNIAVKEVSFRSPNGKVLRGIFFELPYTRKVILLSHGKGNNIYIQIPKARLLLSCGASVFMYDYQGFGLSQGKPSIDGACDDAVAAYDYLVNCEKRTGNDIIAMGQSFGSGVTGQLTERRKLAAVILHSGFASLMSAGRDSLFWLRLYPDWSFPKQMMDNIAVFTKPHPPLLIVHGRTDRIISCAQAIELYNRALEPKQILILPQGHSTFGRGNEFAFVVKEFLRQHKL